MFLECWEYYEIELMNWDFSLGRLWIFIERVLKSRFKVEKWEEIWCLIVGIVDDGEISCIMLLGFICCVWLKCNLCGKWWVVVYGL